VSKKQGFLWGSSRFYQEKNLFFDKLNAEYRKLSVLGVTQGAGCC
jgi:hypothetical protein